MNQTLLIARKDLRAYFVSPIAYIVIAVFLFEIGWMFFNLLNFYAQQMQQFAAVSFGQRPTLADSVLRPLFGNINVVLLMVSPFITMRLFAEEKKDSTIALLLTAPVRPLHIVLGKFLAAFGLLLIMISLTLAYPIILGFITKPDWGVIAGCYFGLIFVAATYAAIGLFWSSLTENQIVAAVLSFGTILFFWLISWSASQAGPIMADVLNHLSLIGHYSNFAQGVFDTVDAIYYISFTGFAIFLTNLFLDSEQGNS
jgi:ABC-2 type transport system permease protein